MVNDTSNSGTSTTIRRIIHSIPKLEDSVRIIFMHASIKPVQLAIHKNNILLSFVVPSSHESMVFMIIQDEFVQHNCNVHSIPSFVQFSGK